MNPEYIEISEEIIKNLDQNKPVVALESSVIAQGLPYPANVETALRLEEIAINLGVKPATIALIDGKIKIGINHKDIERLGTEKNVFKVSKRDIPIVIAKKGLGGTTVAATCFIAALAGIKVFATGGIGGVHPDGQNNFDISADLLEMAQTNIIVVSAGPKSIIDLKLTLEYLETAGVPVIGYKTSICPHFFLNLKEKYPVSINSKTPEEIGNIFKIKSELNINGAILVVNPLDKKLCLTPEEFNEAYKEASKEAKEKDITGNKVTPFLLSKINSLTEGKSQKANLKLLEKNVELASLISKSL